MPPATVILDTEAPGVAALMAERARLGVDRYDEVWDGRLHMSPDPKGDHGEVCAELVLVLGPLAKAVGLRISSTFNIGDGPNNFRVPDVGVREAAAGRSFLDTSRLVVEVVSPGDESWLKFDHYAAHKVDEVLIVDPRTREINWFRLVAGRYEQTSRSMVVNLTVGELSARIDWPATEA